MRSIPSRRASFAAGEWLLDRFLEGYVLSRDPLFPNKVTRYELTPGYIGSLPTEGSKQLIRPCGSYKANARTTQQERSFLKQG